MTIAVLSFVLLTAVRVDYLAPEAGLVEMKAKCVEMREGLLESGRGGATARKLLRDVQVEADALERVAKRSPLPCMCLGAACGGGIGALAGVIYAGSQFESNNNDPLYLVVALTVTAVASLIGAGAGVLLGASGAVTSTLAGRHETVEQHRDVVDGLVLRYNRLMAGRPPPGRRPRFWPPGRLF